LNETLTPTRKANLKVVTHGYGHSTYMVSDTGDKIRHSGTVKAIQGRHVVVCITQSSACAACKLAGHCGASERKVKTVDVYTDQAAQLQIGQVVNVVAERQVAAKAVLYGFILPFVLMVGTLVAVLQVTGSEAKAAAVCLSTLPPYYALLWLLRNRISAAVAFSIET